MNKSERSLDDHGVLVVSISSYSFAAQAIRQGDLILAINKDWVNNSGEFYKKLSDATAQQSVNIAIIRDGIPLILTIPSLDQ